jgi:CPA1 family monovalent cation:H+ antiporter
MVAMTTALVVRRLAVPYTVTLVVVGLALTSLGARAGVRLSSDLIIDGFLPLLLFEAALHVNLVVLRRALPAIVVLAGPGVVLSTVLVGGALVVVTDLPAATAMLFGALISATDPVAVLAIFRELRVPRRVAMLVEGESVLNDGTALVLFSLLAPAAAGHGFDVGIAALQFGAVVLGGLLIGIAWGWAATWVLRWSDDHLVELSLTLILAYGSFLTAEEIGASGVIACVAAGLVFAPRAERVLTGPAAALLTDVWELIAFLANSLLFLLIGEAVEIPDLWRGAGPIAWAVLATVLARAVVVYGLSIPFQVTGRGLPSRERHLVFWSGLRGAVGIALALSVPDDVPGRDLLLQLTLGVVLFTLLAQGLTVRPLTRALLGEPDEPEDTVTTAAQG